MHCGPGARLVSCDRFFNHISRMDPLIKAQFRRWQNLNQMVLEKFVGSEPVFVVISFFSAISCMNRLLSLRCHYGFEVRLDSWQSLKYIIYFQFIAFCLSSLISNPKWRLGDKSLLVSLEGVTWWDNLGISHLCNLTLKKTTEVILVYQCYTANVYYVPLNYLFLLAFSSNNLYSYSSNRKKAAKSNRKHLKCKQCENFHLCPSSKTELVFFFPGLCFSLSQLWME